MNHETLTFRPGEASPVELYQDIIVRQEAKLAEQKRVLEEKDRQIAYFRGLFWSVEP